MSNLFQSVKTFFANASERMGGRSPALYFRAAYHRIGYCRNSGDSIASAIDNPLRVWEKGH
jgi:hypothetical protein